MSAVKVDLKDLRKFQENLNKMGDSQIQTVIEGLAKEIASRLLSKAIKRTPVGQYPKSTGKKGGTLRKGWTAQNGGNLTVSRAGNVYAVEIVNPVEYAPYVEFGHRTRGGGWVEGRFMLTISCDEVRNDTPKIIEQKIQKALGGLFS